MADHSDSDSDPSPKSSSSSTSARRRSPSGVRAHSDEGGSSDGVLVELPAQEARSPGADPDAGVFVSMPADDSTSGETFEDAPEDLASGGFHTARSLDESMAVIDFLDESSVAAECHKYKEERDVFTREAAALRRMLRELVGETEDTDERVLALQTPLHSMLDDCSRLVLELNSVARSREQEVENLHARAAQADVSREVMDINLASWREVSELVIGRIVASVDAVVGKDNVSADQDGLSVVEKKTLFLAERYRQVLLGIEQLQQVLAEVKPGFMAMEQYDHATIFGLVSEELFSTKRNEADLLQKVNNSCEENQTLTKELEEMKAARDTENAQAGKAKAEFEQMEHKLSTTKEKLSMAVTKGKSLVQHRDTLKQTLAEKTGELDRCILELQQKSDALRATEGRIEELKLLLDDKSNEHEKCLDELRETYNAWESANASIEQLNEANTKHTSVQASLSLKDEVLQHIEEVMLEATFPEDLLSLEIIDRLNWLVEQKKTADMILSEHQKLKDILGSVDFPHSVLIGELDSQITWLVNFMSQAKEDAVRMQNESSEIVHRLAAHESKLVSMHEEIDRLTILLLEEKQEKDILVNEHSELMSLYNAAADKLSVFSSQNTVLANALAEVSDVTLEDNESLETTKLVDQCLSNIQRRARAKSSPVECERFEMLQTLAYTLDLELALCKIILNEDTTDRSERMRLSSQIRQTREEINDLKNEKESVQKELERVEEKSSLLREKLSMAVKKGKGLVQEREGLKKVLNEKNSDIQKLEHALDGKTAETEDLKHALSVNNSEIEKLKHALDANNSDIEKLKQVLDENISETENLKQALDEKDSELYKLKQDLDARNTEIENLKYDIVSRESANTDLREQVENLSSLQLNILSLNDEKGKVESMLEEAKVSWGTLVDSISSIALPVDQPFEEPVDKIGQIAQYIMESQAANSSLETELKKGNDQFASQARRLSDSLSTIKILEDELSKVKEYISSTSEEKQQIQLHTAAIEDELEKTNEELAHNANKLHEANMTINSLQDVLSQARANLAILHDEKNEAEAKYEIEISGLNTKLAQCLEELDRTHGNLQSHSTEHHGYLEKLGTLVMDDNIISLMVEEFGKPISNLRDMILTMNSMHEQLSATGLPIDPIMEGSNFSKLLSIPDYDNFATERMLDIKTRKGSIDGAFSLSTIVEQFSTRTEYLSDFLKDLLGCMNDNIVLVLRALQLASTNFSRSLEEYNSLKIELRNKDTQNRAQEAELLALQKELGTMKSKCIYCTEHIQIISDDMLDLVYAIELATGNSSIVSKVEGILSDLKDDGSSDFTKVADTLLSAVNKLKSDSQKLSDIKGLVITSLDDLKMRLKQAESSTESALNDHQLYVVRIRELEKDLKTVQERCNELEARMQEYQEKEDMLKTRELEFLLRENIQTTGGRGIIDEISKDQLETLVEKINKLNIPSTKSHVLRELPTFSSPVDKALFVIDEVDAHQCEMETLRYENEDLQLNLESHAREIEQLKEVYRNRDANRRELESKCSELLEVTASMERMIQRLGYLGEKDVLEDKKSTSTQTLLSKLEKLIIALSTESGNAKSVKEELGAKLQAREKAVDELSARVKILESQLVQPESRDRAFEPSSSTIGSEISEIDDLGPMGKALISSAPTAAHARITRKGSSDHLVLNIGTESERLIATQDSDDKGRIKSLHTSGLIPAQGKHIADRVDGIWVSGSQSLMSRPRARLGLLVYWVFLHLWLVGSIL